MIYFVTEKFLKDETPIGENIDIKKVVPFLKTAAAMRLIPVLGKLFYNDLLTKYNAQTLSVKEKELVNEIQPVVAWYAAAMALPDLNNQRTNKGQQKQSGDYSQSTGKTEQVDAQDQDTSIGRFWLNQLKDYIKLNKEDFPVYMSKENQKNFLFECPVADESAGFNDSILII